MYVDFSTLPASARVWVYQSNRVFTQAESKAIDEQMIAFINNWQRHGEPLKASYKLVYGQFIILAVDESYNDVSGCSIDASVSIIKELENKMGVDLLNKMNVSFKDGDNINTVSLKEFKTYAGQQKIHADTIVFNNMVASKGELESAWETPAANSWHARFLKVSNS